MPNRSSDRLEERIQAAQQLLDIVSKHPHFSGPNKKFRTRYDQTVDFGPFADGFGVMRDAQTAKPQQFRTGDSWFAYNLAQTE